MAILSSVVGNNCVLISKVAGLWIKEGETVADVTYGTGAFWKDVDVSKYTFLPTDINTGVDFCNLPYEDESVDVLVLDPPYTYNPKSTIKQSISVGYRLNESGHSIRTTEDVLDLYLMGMSEAWRVLRGGGRLLLKCKDGIESGKQRWEHIRLFNYAVELGFKAVDLFVLTQLSTPAIRWTDQKHARKNHSYLWVFQK